MDWSEKYLLSIVIISKKIVYHDVRQSVLVMIV